MLIALPAGEGEGMDPEKKFDDTSRIWRAALPFQLMFDCCRSNIA